MTRRWILVVPPTAPHQSSGAGVASHPVQSRSTKGGQPWAPTSRRGDPGWGGGRPPSFRRRPLTGVRRRGLRRRNVVERCFARLEQFPDHPLRQESRLPPGHPDHRRRRSLAARRSAGQALGRAAALAEAEEPMPLDHGAESDVGRPSRRQSSSALPAGARPTVQVGSPARVVTLKRRCSPGVALGGAQHHLASRGWGRNKASGLTEVATVAVTARPDVGFMTRRTAGRGHQETRQVERDP